MKSLNDYFDAIYVINMDTDIQRLQETMEEFQAINSTFERVPGVVYGGGISNSDRVAGCYLSHITALKMAIKKCSLTPYKKIEDYRILICEDDVEFHPDILTDMPKIVSEEYDYLFLNGTGQKIEPGEPYLDRCGQRRQTHCISIHGALVEILYHLEKHFTPLKVISPDRIFQDYPPEDFHLYATKKKYAVQRECKSIITGRTRKGFPEWRKQ